MSISDNFVWQLFLKILPLEVIRSPEGEPYLKRYTCFWTPWFRVYLHNILRSDDDRELHDHPWKFTTYILEGGYLEHVPQGTLRRDPGTVVRHEAEDMHRIELIDGKPAWTFVICGPKVREWGFQCTTRGWVDANHFLKHKEIARLERLNVRLWDTVAEQYKVVGDLIDRLPIGDAYIVSSLLNELARYEA